MDSENTFSVNKALELYNQKIELTNSEIVELENTLNAIEKVEKRKNFLLKELERKKVLKEALIKQKENIEAIAKGSYSNYYKKNNERVGFRDWRINRLNEKIEEQNSMIAGMGEGHNFWVKQAKKRATKKVEKLSKKKGKVEARQTKITNRRVNRSIRQLYRASMARHVNAEGVTVLGSNQEGYLAVRDKYRQMNEKFKEKANDSGIIKGAYYNTRAWISRRKMNDIDRLAVVIGLKDCILRGFTPAHIKKVVNKIPSEPEVSTGRGR